MKRLLMFDFDGVIVDSYDYFKGAFISACDKCGFSEIDSDEKFKKIFELNFYESMEHLGISHDGTAEILAEMHNAIREGNKTFDFFPGMSQALEDLSKENHIYIITSNSTGAVEDFFGRKNLKCVKEVLGSDKEKSKIRKIATLLDRHNDINEFWFIGDTKGDILEGNQAGVDTVAVTWGWHSLETLEEAVPYHIVDEPEELVLLFNEDDDENNE